jgi:hypothetical protein
VSVDLEAAVAKLRAPVGGAARSRVVLSVAEANAIADALDRGRQAEAALLLYRDEGYVLTREAYQLMETLIGARRR